MNVAARAPQPSLAQRRLNRFRAAIEDATLPYQQDADDRATRLYCGETGRLLAIFPAGIPAAQLEYMLHAIENAPWLLSLFDALRRGGPVREAPKALEPMPAETSGNFAANCAMLSKETAFIKFLTEAKGLTDAADQLRVDTFVRKQLAVASRAELNTDPDAAQRWRDLRAEFEAWMATP